ncbi:hypothetical protein BD626DRAFT_631035 [Schizophyllum amplum]|uniref:Protein kinase domain-containing protein n=1 Tax=Schizophyllum amplum TaxID=97359 RepID=A0A550CBY6_9AGAR|nr:hypothetical protein BD626DRAFT_631035 [Auriculariopsis ampla]
MSSPTSSLSSSPASLGSTSPNDELHLLSVTCAGSVRLPLPHVTFRRLSVHPASRVATVAADAPLDARSLRLTVTALLHEGVNARLYRAHEDLDDARMDVCGAEKTTTHRSREFVLKTDFLFAEGRREDTLAREATHYGTAASLQGVVIPRCFGLFEARPKGPFGRPIRCLLLEYCGAPLRARKLSSLPRQVKARIIDKAFYFHDVAGMAHGNLWDGHLLARSSCDDAPAHRSTIHDSCKALHERIEPAADSEPFFVDLSDCTQHACHCTMEVVEGDPKPSPSEFKCKEVWELVCALGVWGSES